MPIPCLIPVPHLSPIDGCVLHLCQEKPSLAAPCMCCVHKHFAGSRVALIRDLFRGGGHYREEIKRGFGCSSKEPTMKLRDARGAKHHETSEDMLLDAVQRPGCQNHEALYPTARTEKPRTS